MMKAVIKEIKNDSVIETVIENVYMVECGEMYGTHGSYEYLELWKNSIEPYIQVKLINGTEVILKGN